MRMSRSDATEPLGHDGGAALVWALALVFVLMTAGLLAASVAQLGMARQRVASAADIAALAGAQTVGDACEAAGRIAVANDTRLEACEFDGVDVVVRLSRPAPPLVRRLFALVGEAPRDVVGSARAGPPELGS